MMSLKYSIFLTQDEPEKQVIEVFNKEHGRRINGAGDGGLGGKNPPEAEACVSAEAEWRRARS